MKYLVLLFALASILFYSSCKKDEPETAPTPAPVIDFSGDWVLFETSQEITDIDVLGDTTVYMEVSTEDSTDILQISKQTDSTYIFIGKLPNLHIDDTRHVLMVNDSDMVVDGVVPTKLPNSGYWYYIHLDNGLLRITNNYNTIPSDSSFQQIGKVVGTYFKL